VREWKALDWSGFAALMGLTLLPIVNTGIKDYPELAGRIPAFVSWPYLPVPLLVIFLGVILIRSLERNVPPLPRRAQDVEVAESLLPPRPFPKIRYQPESEFFLLPLYFRVDASAQIPSVELRFYVVNYLSRPILLSEINVSLQVSGLPPLEDIPLRQKDFRIEPKEYEVITLSRQLTNAERELSWKSGRVPSASFALSARATDGAQSFAYGPVSSMVIEGWISAGFRMPGT